MNQEQSGVKAFMLKAGQECPAKPVIPELGVCLLRYKLIEEENNELKEAFIADDKIAVSDAIGDLLVVVLGTAVACGIEIKPVFDEIMRSNDSKFIDGFRRPDGKWMKGKSWTPPNLAPIIEAQSK